MPSGADGRDGNPSHGSGTTAAIAWWCEDEPKSCRGVRWVEGHLMLLKQGAPGFGHLFSQTAPQVVMLQVMPQGSVPYQLPVAQRVPSQPVAQRVPSQPAVQRVPSQPMMQAAQPVAVPLPPGAVPMQVPMMWVPGQQGAQAQPPWSQRTAPDLNKGK